MTALIQVSSRMMEGSEIQTVNARELHCFLQVGKDFSTWIKDRIEQFGFTENQDFIVFPEIGEKGGRPQMVYHLTLDMAKELSMVERNDQGKKARQYFIECERRLKTVDPAKVLSDPAAMRGLLLTYTEKVLELQPKADALDRIATSDGSLCITDAAKTLQMRPKDLFSFLSSQKWIYRRLGSSWIAYQDKIQSGCLEHKVTIVERNDGTQKTTEQVRVTTKGITRLAELMGKPRLKAA